MSNLPAPHRARRDRIGWGSVIHPPDCPTPGPDCPVVEAVRMGRVFRYPHATFGMHDLWLDAAGVTVVAKQGEVVTAPDRTTVYRKATTP